MTKKRPQSSAVPERLARPRLYVQLADHIARFIEAQGLSPGDRLPPERRLAAELGVSRATLSRALVALEVQGKVEVQHGNGAVVLAPTSLDDEPAAHATQAGGAARGGRTARAGGPARAGGAAAMGAGADLGAGASLGAGAALSLLLTGRDLGEIARAREAVMSGLARGAAAHPDSSLRLALLDADGRPVRFSGTWPCVRRLAGPGLLADLDDLLSEAAPVDDAQVPADRLAALARAVVVGDADAAANACSRLLPP